MADPIDPEAPFARVLLSSLSQAHVVVVPMSADPRGRPREAIVLIDHEGTPRAFINRCKHLPIPIDGGSRAFFTGDNSALLCSTHGARFRLNDGYCFAGPCSGMSLDALRLRVDGGLIDLWEP